MRITVDASCLLLASAGVKTYSWHWLRALRRLGLGDEIRAFPCLPETEVLDHSGSVLPWWRTLPRLGLLYAVNHAPYLLDGILGNADVFHATNLIQRTPRRIPMTATVHDLTSWIVPELHLKSTLEADRLFADRVLVHAAKLLASSENTRQDAMRILGIPADRIEVVYPGINQEYFDAPSTPRERPYVLYVGSIEPRKNIERLLDAWEQLPQSLRDEFDLVIAGARGWAPETTFARVRSTACYLGYVAEAELPGLFAGATVFVYPSLYEGFGFPVAQAMAAGAPVVTSNISSLPEVTADAALLVDPRSTGEIRCAIERLLLSDSLRKELTARGRLQAQQFRWEKAATRSREIFQSVGG